VFKQIINVCIIDVCVYPNYQILLWKQRYIINITKVFLFSSGV